MKPETERSPRRLRKSSTDKVIDGICGGIAEHLQIDSSLVRVAFVLLGLAGGLGVLIYFLAIVIMPSPDGVADSAGKGSGGGVRGYVIIGGLLVAGGVVLFLRTLGILHWHSFSWMFGGMVLPILLIAAGLFLLLRRPRIDPLPLKEGQEEHPRFGNQPRKLYRSRGDKKLFGVCGGLGTYLNVDPTIVRILFVLSCFASFGLTLAAYLILALVVPQEPFQADFIGVSH